MNVRMERMYMHEEGKPEVVKYVVQKMYLNNELVYQVKMTASVFWNSNDIFRQVDNFLLGSKKRKSGQDSSGNGGKFISCFKMLWLKFFRQ